MSFPLQVQGVHKSYAGKKVLEEINLSLVSGEIFGLIGLNGAGKTTIIKIILDLVSADKGSVNVFSKPSSSIKSRENLCYLPEKFQPSRYLKGFEYLSLSLSYYGKTLDPELAKQGAINLDLDPAALYAKVGSYSKGMGQKLGLLGAFLVESSLLVLDEPMSGLDPRARIKLKNMLIGARAAGKTVFFSSHILSDIDEICDRIGIIHQGLLGFVGTPEQFKQTHKEASLEKAFLQSIAIAA